MPHDYSNWHTGQKIRDHELATAIINGHSKEDGNYVFDEEQLQILKKFCEKPTTATRDEMLAEHGLTDELHAAYPGEKAANGGSLACFVIARHGTDNPAFDDRDIELLRDWYAKGPQKDSRQKHWNMAGLLLARESYFTYSDQDESLVNHDIHFRAGVGAHGTETFTPRTVIYDLKGGFGSLRKINALYDVQDDSGPLRGLWDGTVATQQQPPVQPSRYQELLEQGLPTFQLHENDIRYWSDFNRVFYHPRSAVQLNEYELNSQIMPFENWSTGEDLYRNLDKEFDLLDRDVRPFAEECDQIQGFQLLAGTDDAWGGFAAKYMDGLRDEYGKTSIWVWGLEDGARVSRQKQALRSANAARSLRALSQQASAYIRMTAPPTQLPNYIDVTGSSEWVATALLCSAFESITLPTRLNANRARPATLSLLEDTLNTNGKQNLLDLQFSIQRDRNDAFNGAAKNGTHETEINNVLAPSEPANFDVNFSRGPGQLRENSMHIFAQVESDRRWPGTSVQGATLEPDERLRRRLSEETVVERFDTPLPFPMLDTFPETLFQIPRAEEHLEISAALTTSSNMKNSVMQLRSDTVRSLDLDEREAVFNDLTDLANGYSFGWESGSDSGHDS